MSDMTDWAEWSRQAVAEMQARNEEWLRGFSLQGAPYRWDLGTAELIFVRAGDHVVADIARSEPSPRPKGPSAGPGPTTPSRRPPCADWTSSGRSVRRTTYRC
jgi:hypothetical protein